MVRLHGGSIGADGIVVGTLVCLQMSFFAAQGVGRTLICFDDSWFGLGMFGLEALGPCLGNRVITKAAVKSIVAIVHSSSRRPSLFA